MDPFSLATGIAGLAGFVTLGVSTTYQYGSIVVGASEAQKSLLSELQHLQITLVQLQGLVAQSNASTDQYPHVSARLGSAVNECTTCMTELSEKLQSKADAGRTKSTIKRLVWPLTEKDILKTVAALDRYKGLFQLGLGIGAWWKKLSHTNIHFYSLV